MISEIQKAEFFQRKIPTFFLVTLALVMSSLGLARQLWAWPDVIWQASLYYLPDIDLILSGQPDQAIWLDIGQGHSLNGHRIFTYLNAILLGFYSRLDLIVYWILVFVVSAGLVIFLRRYPGGNLTSFVTSILGIFVMTSLAGAGATGMELGTYFGQFLMLGILLLAIGGMGLPRFFVISSFAVPLILFLFLGGYIAGWAFALGGAAVVSFARFRSGTLELNVLKKISVLALSSSIWTIIFLLLIPRPQGPSVLFDAVEKDILFPLKYVVFGFASSFFNYQSFETFTPDVGYVLAFIAGALLLVFSLTVFVLSFHQKSVAVVFGQTLVLFGLGTSLSVMANRAFTDQWLLANWYSFNFKIAFVGSLVLFAFCKIQGLGLLRSLSAVVILAMVATSYSFAYQRGPHERAYWTEIQKAVCYPDTIADRGDGYTQLIASVEVSLKSVEIMKKHNLSMYRTSAQDLCDF